MHAAQEHMIYPTPGGTWPVPVSYHGHARGRPGGHRHRHGGAKMDIPDICPTGADGSDDVLDRAAQRLFYFELLRYSNLNERDDFRSELAALRDDPTGVAAFCERWGVQQHDVERSLRLQQTVEKPRLLVARTYKQPSYSELLHAERRRLLRERLAQYCEECGRPPAQVVSELVEGAMFLSLGRISSGDERKWLRDVRREIESALLDGRTLDAAHEQPGDIDIESLRAYTGQIEDLVLTRIECEEALKLLSETERCLVDDYAAGYSYTEIAQKHNVSVSAIKMRFARIKEKLRR